MKSIEFRGTALADLRAFPLDVKRDAGYRLDRIQRGKAADDVKPLTTVGPGVMEIRVWDEAGTFRVVYVAKLADAVYVLHCFQKKTRQTALKDIALAQKRYRDLIKELQS